jgi:hypothetical protein
VYPFNPEHYVTFQDEFELHYWYRWPKKWYEPIGLPGDVPVKRIVRDLLTAMRTGLPVDYRNTMGYGANLPTANGVPPITWNIDVEGGEMAKYKIYPGDQTSIYDHIQALSEMTEKGFEWDITPLTLEFRLWMPRKWIHDAPVYTFRSTGVEGDGAIIEFDWTNEGPEGTYLYGYAAVDYKVGAHWTYQRSLDQHGRYDLVHDFGKIANYDVLLQKLKDQNDLWAQKKLSLAIYNPEFLAPTQPNFYTGDRPRSLIGNTIRVTHNFAPYHTVDAYFRINAIKWSVDPSSNETVTLELEMVYEPDTGNSGENA